MAVGEYTRLVTSGNPKVVAFVDWLDKKRQIDLDDTGDPHVVRVTPVDEKTSRVFISRNNYEHNFIINHRKRPDPTEGVVMPIRMSWDMGDGWSRPATERKRVAPPVKAESMPSGKERPRRVSGFYEAEALRRFR